MSSHILSVSADRLPSRLTSSSSGRPESSARFESAPRFTGFATEGQVNYFVRAIEARCPRVFGAGKQAFPLDITEELYSMLRLLRQRGSVNGNGDVAGPVRAGASDAELGVLARTITTDQLCAVQNTFMMLEDSMA